MNGYLVKQCGKITTPIFFGYIAIGMPFGIMIVRAGYPWWMSLFMSLTMYSGAGQYIAAGMLGAGAGLAELLLTELFVNIRHIVYGLSLLDKSKSSGWWKNVVVYTLTDETYAILSSTDIPPNTPSGPFMGLIGLFDFAYWILGGVLGAVACNVLEHYHMAHYLNGVDFALTSLFVIILTGQIQKTKDVFPPVTGAIFCLAAVVLCKLGLLASSNTIFFSILLSINCIVLVRGKSFYEQNDVPAKKSVFILVTAVCIGIASALVLMQCSMNSGAAENFSVSSEPSAPEHVPLWMAVIATLLSGVIVFCERLFPFALFSKKDPPPLIHFIERYIPSMIIAILVIYSLKDVTFTQSPYGLPHFAGIVLTLLLNRLFNNPMITIFGSTAAYMVLTHIL